MKQVRGRLIIRRIEIVDDLGDLIYSSRNVPFEKGIKEVFRVINAKDGNKSIKNVFISFFEYLDKDFKKLLNIEVGKYEKK